MSSQSKVQSLISDLDAAIKHRARIGAEICISSPKMLIKLYEDALDEEGVIRANLAVAIQQEKSLQLAAACMK